MPHLPTYSRRHDNTDDHAVGQATGPGDALKQKTVSDTLRCQECFPDKATTTIETTHQNTGHSSPVPPCVTNQVRINVNHRTSLCGTPADASPSWPTGSSGTQRHSEGPCRLQLGGDCLRQPASSAPPRSTACLGAERRARSCAGGSSGTGVRESSPVSETSRQHNTGHNRLSRRHAPATWNGGPASFSHTRATYRKATDFFSAGPAVPGLLATKCLLHTFKSTPMFGFR